MFVVTCNLKMVHLRLCYRKKMVNFKGFMTDIAHANWKTMRKIYRDGDPSLPMVSQECTYFFYYSTNLDKVTQ